MLSQMTNTKKTLLYSLIIIVISLIIYFIIPNKFYTILVICTLVSLILSALFLLLKKDVEFPKNMILATGFGVTIISWFVTGYINNENEINRNRLAIEQSTLQKKRELKTKFLIDAFFKLQNYDNRVYESHADAYIYGKFSENSLSEIQLLGDTDLVKTARNFALANGKSYFSDLLIQLRNDLRNELGVSSLPLTDDFAPFNYRVSTKSAVYDTLTSKDQLDLIIKLNQLNQEFIK